MSEVTAVPLRPIAKGSLTKLWVGIAAVVALAVGAAYVSTQSQVVMAMTPEEFLASNRGGNVVETASGLQYRVLEEGSGRKPTVNDLVLVDFEGKLPNGDVFESSARHGGPSPMPLQGMIGGWTEGLQLMNSGAKYRFWMKPELAFGPGGIPGKVPPNSIVVFDVKLKEVLSPETLGMGGMMPPGHGGM
ncbi:FKBP-type peptidyl-prolyl cis-trans isomerase [Rhizorhabdus sp. FW153]|jgi:FKBP-type peptidyl-prolyl cis-trans isomerase|uniref:FKBP-type peptidyl-prolyl cis-trans isomerase n=1 Tax=Rhizorhabdus sp. FW153 TaxID=3400216 RepID=UPI003CF43C59